MIDLETYIIESKSSTVYLMVGMPGAGKSTWCKKNHPDIEVVSRDIIRAELDYTKSADHKAVLTKEQEEEVTEYQNNKIDELCSKGESFIIDDTNTSRFRKAMIDRLHKNGAKVIGIFLDTDLETCIERRKGQIPEVVMRKIHKNMVPIKRSEVDELKIIK